MQKTTEEIVVSNVLELKKNSINRCKKSNEFRVKYVKKKVTPRTITGKLQNKSKKQNQINKTMFEAAIKKDQLPVSQ